MLHVGTIEPRKNVQNLLRAYELLRAHTATADVELVLVGGAWPGAWEALRLPASGRVHRLGFVVDADLPALQRGAAAVAYPSIEEGFGLPVLEALACGAPVVTSAGSVMAELAAGAAVLVDPLDPGAIADGLAAAIRGEGPARPQRLVAAAAFTWERAAAGHAAVYRSVLP